MDIIVKKSRPKGKRRSQVEKDLVKEGWGTSITPEQIDKCEYVESIIKEHFGSDHSFVKTKIIDKVK